ncbi:phosphoserine phosphatase SerB [Demequina sp. TTPB684]|uniref:phosphoserine phosphatase SerB n=1 Tax=unclassified Demequina TaxID=2620311 RepID=UPI001CF1CBE5|nr:MULTISPECIES: phosphoserine phosphatase SerB [unclassified Demequina]MCB2413897.1 phosphoserine phosphatase SerB [Demequina sp. TTPB684]UPU89415.1 phosphoserine phosphatase SerB [Demequina sp. TMPB413]
MTARRLIVLDVDSTLIRQEVIELLADRAGSGEQVAQITDRAMRGEIDFAESLAQRVATLRGLPTTVFHEVAEQVELTQGALELLDDARAAGWAVALVSGGFEEIVTSIAHSVSVELFVANRLEVAEGHLTGRTKGPVIDRNAKAVALAAFARATGVALQDTVAVGDGANDLGMMAAAGTSVAFAAKPIVREAADIQIDGPTLSALWPLIRS